MDSPSAFVADNQRLIEACFGDLDGDGRPDAVLVLEESHSGDSSLPANQARSVVLLLRDQAGALAPAAANPRIVPPRSAGGTAGDPFGYVSVAEGAFMIVNGGGGSRTRWWDEFSFTWSADARNWFASHVLRQAIDSVTGEEARIELRREDMGPVSFADFDPSRLPEARII